LSISFAYDKLKIVWAGYDANAERRIIQGFLLIFECDTMGMCNIGNEMRVQLYESGCLESLEGAFCGRKLEVNDNRIEDR